MVNLEQTLQPIVESDLALPCLLFLVGHRPCAFMAGQLLYVIAPLAALLGAPACQAWAALLSQPEGVHRLEQALSSMVGAKKG